VPAQQGAQPRHLDPQACALRLIGALRPERPRHQQRARHILRPRFAECPHQREQQRPPSKGHLGVRIAHHVAAGIHDERP
jgi:hypothetical protein